MNPSERASAGWRTRGTVACVAVAMAGGCAAANHPEPPQQAQLTRAVSAPERLTPPAELPGPARQILHARMAAHAQDMGELMRAIMVLQYDVVQTRAEAIATDVNFARPLTGDATELNTLLPGKFFDLQDELRTRARALGAAAASKDALAVADAYGRVSETCVKCHATYRAGQ